ncbi:hypothetical protein C1M55_28340 [Rhodococcus qingshengii]|uniref:hypothetical protein n=1 Tax=Rhodococcus qingshengii TaxID=334542 RepID=UPI000C9FED72|nr:hypothetical protein [Rhodococcus qingshengii]AUS34641.1 hypothetical protein C1M55_28340 [Rhodococcus qingshengii]
MEQTNAHTVAESIQELLDAQQISRRELSRRAAIANTTLDRHMIDDAFTVPQLFEIARVLGVLPSMLMSKAEASLAA